MNQPDIITIDRWNAPPLTLLDFEDGISAIDTGVEHPMFDSHLLLEGGHAAFVDIGADYSLPNLQAVLDFKRIEREAVDYLILTHPELADGVGKLMRYLPSARLVVHAEGARHMIDPSAPSASERVHPAKDGDVLELNGRPLRVIHTLGHPQHHFSLYDESSRSIFAGDAFGVSYREFDTETGAFIFPCSAALHFEPRALHAAINRLMDYEPAAMYLSHYGRVEEVPRLAAELHIQIDQLAAIAWTCHGFPDRHERLTKGIEAFLMMGLASHGCPLHPDECRELLARDIDLTARELEIWLDTA